MPFADASLLLTVVLVLLGLWLLMQLVELLIWAAQRWLEPRIHRWQSRATGREHPFSGPESMHGRSAQAERDFVHHDGQGYLGTVRVDAERWRARSDHPVRAGDRVRVHGRDGLRLHVRQEAAEKS